MIKQLNLDWQTASTLCLAACNYAAEQNLSICVWVLDRHGNPLAMQRHNEAPLASTEIARRKAWTAVSFGFPTDQWPQRLKDQPYLLNSLSQQTDMAMFGGGLPILSESQLVGAIGVSGASEQQDMQCAQNALSSLQLI
ncbi:GlcG/HbpS family heme-binding protein [Amphritea sp. HPY]|uniref:GlcG/HbpS family heme-binding protein n=1 Tax=Amphritea sp. HPY TaxID=3421652 RepID=UPI003D7D4AF3